MEVAQTPLVCRNDCGIASQTEQAVRIGSALLHRFLDEIFASCSPSFVCSPKKIFMLACHENKTSGAYF
jgi:hypothetical protein